MPKIISLKKSGQFRAVYNRGKSLADKNLVVYALRNKSDVNRLGMSVSKKVGNSVQRNHIRRLIREAYRMLDREGVRIGFDLVVIARAPAAGLDYSKMLLSLTALFRRHDLFETQELSL